MRFAATALIAVYIALQTPVRAQEASVQEAPAEPPLAAVIGHFFPGYEVLPLGELRPEIGALTVSDAAYGDADRSPTSIRADFDGNGVADYALLIGRAAGPERDEIFVILMGHGEGRYSTAMESFFGGIAPDIYLGYLPAGTVLAAPAPTLEHPAVTLNVFGRASDAFYWDGASSRFRTAPAPRR